MSIAVERPEDTESRIREVEKTTNALQKEHGQGTIIRLGSKEMTPVDVIPTGIYGIDYHVIGVGGIPRGRMTELIGAEGGGKSTLAMHVVANAQKAGGVAAYLDIEASFDPYYASALGVDTENLFLASPDHAEQALSIAESLIETNCVDVIVIDSVAALIPLAELNGDIADANIALQARLMSKALRKLTGVTSKSNTAVIWVNQLRANLGITYGGSHETTPGGRALRFYASLRLDVRRIAKIGAKEEDPTGNKTKVRAIKNKLAPPFREHEVDLIYGQGFDNFGSIADCAIDAGLCEKSGSWLSLKLDDSRYQGRGQFRDALAEDPALVKKIIEQLQA